MNFSLVLATYGREIEIENFLESISKCNYNLSKIQIIIVDQNDKINLDYIVCKFKNTLNIIHIKSKVKGLSINRNVGLEYCTGDIIAFPDDDCEYLQNTLKNVEEEFEKFDVDIVMGKIVERDGSDSLRAWPKENIKINKNNFYTKCSSITIFLKNKTCILGFNERLGVGGTFGSCEDTDILYRNLNKNKNVKYDANVKIYHPHYDSKTNMSKEKVEKYGMGFGAFVKANLDFTSGLLFIQIIIYHFLKAILNAVKFDFSNSRKSFIALRSRIQGLIKYKK